MDLASILSQFSFSEATGIIRTLIIVVAGMTLYAVYVHNFYEVLSRKNLFGLDLRRHSRRFSGHLKNLLSILLYTLEYLIIFPLFVLFWFMILSALLIFLSSNNSVSNILLLSMGLVATIRVTSYYSEELSHDLAKLVPFSLLAVFLTNISQFSLVRSIQAFMELPSLWKEATYYFIFVVLLELVMRASLAFTRYMKGEPIVEPEEEEE